MTSSLGLDPLRRSRRRQIELFPECALNYPAWDIVLMCYAAQVEDAPLCVKQIECQIVDTHASLLRRIDALAQAGIVERRRDQSDSRRTHVVLTEDGVARMEAYLKPIRAWILAGHPS